METQLTKWTGWIVFTGVILVVGGVFNAVQGLAALFGPNDYYIVSEGSLWLLDVNGWGWWNLILGISLILTAAALFTGRTWSRVVAVILVSLNALGQMLLVTAQPWWSLIMIAVDILILYALIVHGRELRAEAVEA